MSDVEKYLGEAERAERMAGELTDGVIRAEFLKMAAEWRRLAAQAQALGEQRQKA